MHRTQNIGIKHVFLTIAVFIGLLVSGHLVMLLNNPQLAFSEDMVLMEKETLYTIIAVISAAIVYALSRYRKAAIVAGLLALIFSIGYGGYILTYRQTLDIGVWSSAITIIIVMVQSAKAELKIRNIFQKNLLRVKPSMPSG